MRRAALLSFALALTCAAPAGATHVPGHPPTAAQIYDHALAFARAQTYPPFISYIVTVRAKVKDKWLVEQFASICRSSDDRVITDLKPLSTTNQAESPYGFNLKVKGLQIHDPSDIDEPFGVPLMSPQYSYGLATLRPSSTADPEYDVALAGIEDVRDHKAYHLTLTPRRLPATNRLRDLWIDVQTDTIWRLTTEGIFPKGQATTVPWTVEFDVQDGRWFTSTETTSTPLSLGGYAPALNEYVKVPFSSRYSIISYAFSNFDYPKQVPEMMFFEHRSSEATQM